jgi:hypothetical protein
MTLSLLQTGVWQFTLKNTVLSISSTNPCRDPVEFILYCLYAEQSVAIPDSGITKAAEQPMALIAQIQNVIILLIAWLFEWDFHHLTVPGNLFQLLVHVQYMCVMKVGSFHGSNSLSTVCCY